MDCSRAKELLSEYIDGLADKELDAEVRAHLLECGDCRNELEAMKAVVREVGSLDRVKAPDGFLADLHGRIEKDSWLQKVKKFISMPSRIGIPAELATLATTVVLAFFIFHIVQLMPLKGPDDLKDTKTELEIRSDKNSPVSGSGIKAPEQMIVTDKIVQAPQKKQKAYDSEPKSKPSPEVPATEAFGSAETDQIRRYGEITALPAPSKTIEPLQMTLILNPAGGKMILSSESRGDAQKPAEKAARMSAPVQLQSRVKADIAEVKSGDEALLAGKSNEEKDKPVYQGRLVSGLEESVRNAGGIVLKTDIRRETGQPEELLIEIPGQNYRKLVEKLAGFGEIQIPVEGDPGQSGEPVQVRIRIIPSN